MANPKADFNNPEFTGLASRCWAVFASTYNPIRIIEMCREVQMLEAERDNLKAWLEMALGKGDNDETNEYRTKGS